MKSTAAPAGAQALDDAEQPLDLDGRQRGRRLVHDDHLGVERQRLADLHDLLLGDRQPAGDAGRIEPDAEALEHLQDVRAHPAAVDAPPADERLPADEDVLLDREVGEQDRLLVDDRDPGVARVRGAVEQHLAPVDAHDALRPAGARRRGSSRASTCPRRSRRRAPCASPATSVDRHVLERADRAEASSSRPRSDSTGARLRRGAHASTPSSSRGRAGERVEPLARLAPRARRRPARRPSARTRRGRPRARPRCEASSPSASAWTSRFPISVASTSPA